MVASKPGGPCDTTIVPSSTRQSACCPCSQPNRVWPSNREIHPEAICSSVNRRASVSRRGGSVGASAGFASTGAATGLAPVEAVSARGVDLAPVASPDVLVDEEACWSAQPWARTRQIPISNTLIPFVDLACHRRSCFGTRMAVVLLPFFCSFQPGPFIVGNGGTLVDLGAQGREARLTEMAGRFVSRFTRKSGLTAWGLAA